VDRRLHTEVHNAQTLQNSPNLDSPNLVPRSKGTPTLVIRLTVQTPTVHPYLLAGSRKGVKPRTLRRSSSRTSPEEEVGSRHQWGERLTCPIIAVMAAATYSRSPPSLFWRSHAQNAASAWSKGKRRNGEVQQDKVSVTEPVLV
jgi:hypothetical protein